MAFHEDIEGWGYLVFCSNCNYHRMARFELENGLFIFVCIKCKNAIVVIGAFMETVPSANVPESIRLIDIENAKYDNEIDLTKDSRLKKYLIHCKVCGHHRVYNLRDDMNEIFLIVCLRCKETTLLREACSWELSSPDLILPVAN
jgi:hypothetical protein